MNPYQVLGISPSASQEEIREAYMKLVKKYHPDRYQDSNLKKQAEDKMKQINAAYDMLTKKQSGSSSSSYGPGSSQSSAGYGGYGSSGGYGSYGPFGGYGSYGPFGGYGQYGSYGSGSQSGQGAQSGRAGQGGYSGQYASEFSRVRAHINSGNIGEAENILRSIPLHNAEWNFLYGMCCYRNGQYTRAYEYISRACQMDPANMEYRSALASMRGASSTTRTWTSRGSDYSCCSLCGTALCANLLCNMCCRSRF